MAKVKALITLRPNHPSGQFRRFGKVFTNTPEVFVLEAEQVEFLKAIDFLMVRTQPDVVARFDEVSDEEVGEVKQDRMTKAQIIAALEAKGLVAETDFDAEATKAALLELLNA